MFVSVSKVSERVKLEGVRGIGSLTKASDKSSEVKVAPRSAPATTK